MYKDFLERIIMERIDQILQKNKEASLKFYENQEAVLNQLDDETREKFREFSDNIMEIDREEYILIYKEAFLDGLRIGHKAFGNRGRKLK